MIMQGSRVIFETFNDGLCSLREIDDDGNAGLEKARKEGRVGGRRPKLSLMQQQEIIRMVKSGNQTAADAARMFNVHPATITRLLQKSKI